MIIIYSLLTALVFSCFSLEGAAAEARILRPLCIPDLEVTIVNKTKEGFNFDFWGACHAHIKARSTGTYVFPGTMRPTMRSHYIGIDHIDFFIPDFEEYISTYGSSHMAIYLSLDEKGALEASIKKINPRSRPKSSSF